MIISDAVKKATKVFYKELQANSVAPMPNWETVDHLPWTMAMRKAAKVLLKGLVKGLAVILCLYSVNAFAAPAVSSVTGTFSHNGTVTVNGSGFGTKSPVAPAIWDNLSAYVGYTNGQTIPFPSGCEYGNYCTGTNPAGWDSGNGRDVGYCTINPRGKWTAAYSNRWTGDVSGVGGAALGGRTITGVSTSHVAYLTWYLYAGSDPSGGGNSNKFLRLDSAGYGTPGEGEIVIGTTHVYPYPYGGSETDYWDGWAGNHPAWNRFEVIVDANNDVFAWYTNNALEGSHPFTYNWYPRIINDIGADAANEPMGTIDWNTIYADNTLSRVEVCNAATKSGSTHCEIQIPTTSWSASSLQITVNQGSFADSSTAYLYVADSTGTFNSTGYSVTFGAGGGGDTTPPTITAFTMPSTASSLTVNVSSFTATDDTAVTGYCITTTNSSSGCSWSGSAPSTATASGAGAVTWYAWARDAAGNVSNASTASTTITLPNVDLNNIPITLSVGRVTIKSPAINLMVTSTRN
jgi:hypothetical protein